MKRVLVFVFAASATMIAGEAVDPAGATPTRTAAPKVGRVLATVRLLRKLTAAEPSAAIRLSGWGIAENTLKTSHAGTSSPSKPATVTRTVIPSRTLCVTTQ